MISLTRRKMSSLGLEVARPVQLLVVTVAALSTLIGGTRVGRAQGGSFSAFESEQFRPLALSANGARLFVANTPDNRLEIFDVTGSEPVLVSSVVVGLEPVAVAARNDDQVWVVNHLSDSVSIVDLAGSEPRVVRTLLVGDEPRDVVFAGAGNSRAFVSAAHRGQNSPYTNPSDPGELTTPGVGRTDVWVFDATDPGAGPGGTPLDVLTFFGDSAGPLARSADGASVYVGVFKSGNRTTTLSEPVVCDGGQSALPCSAVPSEATSPGGSPAPNSDVDGITGPEVGLIVRHDGLGWLDELGRDWSPVVRFTLPDLDVFRVDATAAAPVETGAYPGVGTVLFGMAVNPVSGRVYVANIEARNEIRFAGVRPPGSTLSSVRGRFTEARVTVIDPTSGAVTPRHLNPHIDYALLPASPSVKERSLATPQGLAVSSDGTTLFIAAKGSARVGIFDTAELEAGTFVPDVARQVPVTGGGPTGLVLDDSRARLYVLTRFDNGLSVIDTATATEVAHIKLHNPEPPSITNGRPFLYDARLTSGNGEVSCASCHVGGDKDELAWDLGDPLGHVVSNPNPFTVRPPFLPPPVFHSMKGPMTTQTLRGLATHGPMHWRGDKTGAFEPGGSALDAHAAFRQFNAAFVDLQGLESELPDADMEAFTDFMLQVLPPPNPIRNLDDSLTPAQADGAALFATLPVNGFGATCQSCHALDRAAGFFGANGRSMTVGPPGSAGQIEFKGAQLRNAYEKVGMFGMPAIPVTVATGDHGFTGNQIRGFGFFHDGAFDSVLRTLRLAVFAFPGGDAQRRAVEQFIFAFDSNLKPVVGQQITISSDSSSSAHARADLLIARAAAGDADLVVRGVVGDVARGWLRLGDGSFASDSSRNTPISEPTLRALAAIAGQELTYSSVPPGSGRRIAHDRDDDGFRDRDEIDEGTDPSDAASVPLVPLGISSDTMSVRSRPATGPSATRLRFVSRLSQGVSSGVVAPEPGSNGDPTVDGVSGGGGTLVLYAADGAGERVTLSLPARHWRKTQTSSPGYRYSDEQGMDGPIRSVRVRSGLIEIRGRGAALFQLDGAPQGSMTVKLRLGDGIEYCASALARPPASLNDSAELFFGERRTPAPARCPGAVYADD